MKLADRVRARESAEGLPNAGSVSAALTLGTRVDATVLRTVLTACRRKVLRIVYASPWKEPPQPPRTYTIEPWALRVHDGAAYLRAWSRGADAPRTFRVADIERVDEAEPDQEEDRARARVAKLLKAGLRGLGEERPEADATASSRDRRADGLPEIMLRARGGDRAGDRSASVADEMTNARADKVGGS